jgi:hypothetical protein
MDGAFIKEMVGQEWWNMSVKPALKSLRQKDCKFKASLSYIVRLCLKRKKEI